MGIVKVSNGREQNINSLEFRLMPDPLHTSSSSQLLKAQEREKEMSLKKARAFWMRNSNSES